MARFSQRIPGWIGLGLDAVLLLGFVVQAFLVGCLLIYGHLPLPTEWMNRQLARHLPEGVVIEAASYRLFPNGSIQAESLTGRLAPHELPVFTADLAILQRETGRDGTGRALWNGLTLSGGRFFMPAVYAPDGKRTVLLDNIAAKLRLQTERLDVQSFTARHAELKIRGAASLPITPTHRPASFHAPNFSRALYTPLESALKEAARLEHLSEPTLRLQLNGLEPGVLELEAEMRGPSLEYGALEAREVTLLTRLSLRDGVWSARETTRFEAESFQLAAPAIHGVGVTLLLEPDDWARLIQGQGPTIHLAAESLSLGRFSWTQPQLELSARELPLLTFSGTAGGTQGAFAFEGVTDLKARTASVQAMGDIDLIDLAGPDLPEELASLHFATPPYYRLRLSLGPGYVPEAASLSARSGRFSLNGITFDHLDARGTYHAGMVDFPHVHLRRGWQWLDLGLHLDVPGQHYRVQLVGSAKPYDYNAILPNWWAAIFEDFDFETVSNALGDFVISGTPGAPAADFFFGHVRAKSVAYKAVRVDEASLFVRGRGPYAEIFDMDLRLPDGWARGAIRFSSRLDEVPGPQSVRFDLNTRMPIDSARKLFDGTVADVLADFDAPQPFEAAMRGAIFNEAYPEFDGLSHLRVRAESQVPLRYKGLPLATLRFDLWGQAAQTYLRSLHAEFAGGQLSAEADILTGDGATPRVRLKGRLQAAAATRVETLLREFLGRKTTPRDASRLDPDGHFDMMLHAEGPADDAFALEGFGRFRLKNEALAKIQLFGPISTLLERARIGYTTFGLDTMSGDFSIDGGALDFKALHIDGPQTRILAPGTFRFADQSLNMRVSVYLFGNAGNPNSRLRQLQQWVSQPIPNLLEFQLTGTLNDQKWRSVYDVRNLLPSPLNRR